MSASLYDSALYAGLMRDADVAALFADSAEVRAMLLVEGALAKVQGALGVIPEDSAAAIHRASLEAQIDPGALSAQTGKNAVPVPALVAAFRAEIGDPGHAQYAHWGATSQDIIDTGLVLRLRRVIGIYRTGLARALGGLGALAGVHAELPMAARTYGQVATPTSFGAIIAAWGTGLFDAWETLADVERRLLCVSLSGAGGTGAALGDQSAAIRAALAEELDLRDPETGWHSNREAVAGFAAWITQTTAALGKMGEDLILLTQSDSGEVRLAGAGGSSTMPQKQNPVAPSVMVAVARHTAALNTAMQGAAIHRQQRDATAWITEWLSLPQMCMGLGRALKLAAELAETLQPVPDRMIQGIDPDGLGLIYAEALSFHLAQTYPRPEVQAKVKALCLKARETNQPLAKLAQTEWPGAAPDALFSASAQLGEAPAMARAFAARAKVISQAADLP